MRSVHTRLARKIGLALAVAVILTLAIASVGLAQEAAPDGFPDLGHYFFGTAASCGDLKPLPPGTVVTAKAATGDWKGTSLKHSG